jgi:hypothetical protein
MVPSNDNEQLLAAVAKGPVSVALDASPLQFYDSGILLNSTTPCDPDHLSHAVLIVGYGKEAGIEYWLVSHSYTVSILVLRIPSRLKGLIVTLDT